MKKLIISVICIVILTPVFSQVKYQADTYNLSQNGLLVKNTKSFQLPNTTESASLRYSPILQYDDAEAMYNLYKNKYENAKKFTTVGAVISITGFGLFAGGLGILLLEAVSNDGNVNTDPPVKMMVSSYFFISVGLPIWISQYTKAKNNKQAMEKLKPVKLGLGITENGAGLIVSF